MILTCPQCQAQYRLDPKMLGTTGREVRCVGCSHTWFQMSENAVPEPPPPPPPEAAPPPEPAPPSINQALDKILEQDDAAFEAILSDVNTARAAVSQPPLARSAEIRPQAQEKPGSFLPEQSALSVVTHNPFGVSAPVFGGLAFASCVFLTLTVVFLAQKPILRHWPQMALLYATMGFDLKAPGEGLRIDEVTAEQRLGRQDKTLMIEGKITNMTPHDMDSPDLRVVMKSSLGVVMKTWDVDRGSMKIVSGDSAPLMLQLSDAPEGGFTVDVRVKGE